MPPGLFKTDWSIFLAQDALKCWCWFEMHIYLHMLSLYMALLIQDVCTLTYMLSLYMALLHKIFAYNHWTLITFFILHIYKLYRFGFYFGACDRSVRLVSSLQWCGNLVWISTSSSSMVDNFLFLFRLLCLSSWICICTWSCSVDLFVYFSCY